MQQIMLLLLAHVAKTSRVLLRRAVHQSFLRNTMATSTADKETILKPLRLAVQEQVSCDEKI